MHRPDFERLCDFADVRGLRVGITVDKSKRCPGVEQFRDLEAIVITDEEEHNAYPRARIQRSIDAAARRLLEALTK